MTGVIVLANKIFIPSIMRRRNSRRLKKTLEKMIEDYSMTIRNLEIKKKVEKINKKKKLDKQKYIQMNIDLQKELQENANYWLTVISMEDLSINSQEIEKEIEDDYLKMPSIGSKRKYDNTLVIRDDSDDEEMDYNEVSYNEEKIGR